MRAIAPNETWKNICSEYEPSSGQYLSTSTLSEAYPVRIVPVSTRLVLTYGGKDRKSTRTGCAEGNNRQT